MGQADPTGRARPQPAETITPESKLVVGTRATQRPLQQ
jgi:hypothetical protein